MTSGPPLPDLEDAGASCWVGAGLLRLGHALAGLLVLGVVLANFNPSFGFFHESRGAFARLWPWEVFREDGALSLHWLPAHVWVLAFTFSGLTLVACALLPAGRLRGGLALTAFALLATALIGNPPRMLIGAGANVALALAVGASAAAGRPAGRRLLWMGFLALGMFLLLPVADTRTEPGAEQLPYMSIGRGLVEQIGDALSGRPAQGLDPTMPVTAPQGLLDSFLGSMQAYAWLLGLLFAGLALLLRGRGPTRWLMALPLLLAVLGPPAWIAHDRISTAEEIARGTAAGAVSAAQMLEVGGRGAAESILFVLRIALLPLALGLADLLRRPTGDGPSPARS